MKQSINVCSLLMFAVWSRLAQVKGVVYTLLAILILLAFLGILVHAGLHTHALVLGPNSDPWNG